MGRRGWVGGRGAGGGGSGRPCPRRRPWRGRPREGDTGALVRPRQDFLLSPPPPPPQPPCAHAPQSGCRSPPRPQKLGEPLVTHYELAQSVYAKATIDVHESDKVCLWLGANVMLEYPRSEAIELLARQLADAKKGLATVIDDMGFLREQITITEVNMARVFNWDVKERRKQKEAAEKEGS